MIRRLAMFAYMAFITGCSFSRTVVNAHVRDLNTSWIVVGSTTKSEVESRIGRPPSVFGVGGNSDDRDAMSRYFDDYLGIRPKGMDVKGEDIDSAGMTAYRWFAADSRSGSFEGGYWVIPTFSKAGAHRAHDILIAFDRRDVVMLVSRTETDGDKVKILEWRE